MVPIDDGKMKNWQMHARYLVDEIGNGPPGSGWPGPFDLTHHLDLVIAPLAGARPTHRCGQLSKLRMGNSRMDAAAKLAETTPTKAIE